jgi:hypothetical protein
VNPYAAAQSFHPLMSLAASMGLNPASVFGTLQVNMPFQPSIFPKPMTMIGIPLSRIVCRRIPLVSFWRDVGLLFCFHRSTLRLSLLSLL